MSRSYRKPYTYLNAVTPGGIRQDKKVNKSKLKTKSKKLLLNLLKDLDYDSSYKIGETNKEGLDVYVSNGDIKIRISEPTEMEWKTFPYKLDDDWRKSYNESLKSFHKLNRK